ncbi:tetratricopeptide repeat-containing sensor histidine kinase [Aquimarina algiphila]|uniref:tetratricopeptide repeat-containing sensor histidine kinase n=1 Tax=Aquimarina algiphila TaxID=2047982 RepID=UPI0024924255|nr:sensor histidine kinase [Aquimarina algiphila]
MFRSKIYTFTLVVVLHYCAFSQQKEVIVDLIDKVENATNKNEKLQLLDSLSGEIGKMHDKDFEFYKQNFSKYTLQYINLAKQLDSIDLAAFRTSKLTYHYLQVINKPDSALVIVNNILGDSNKIKNRINLGHLYVKKAGANYQIDDLEKAIIDYNNAEKVYHETKDTIYEADAVYFNGQATERLGRLSQAVIKYQTANTLYTAMKDTAYMAYSGLAISGIFSQLYLLEKSFEERKRIRALLNSQKNKDYRALSELSINDARDFVKTKEYIKEGEAYLKALELAQKGKLSVFDLFRIRAYVSGFYSKHDETEIAQRYLDTLELTPELVKNPYDRMFYLKALGTLKKAQGKYNEAIPIFEEELEIFKKSNDLQSQVHIEKELYESNKGANNFSDAIIHLDRHLLLKDSLYNITRSNSVIYYQTLYETEKRDSKIAIQKANIDMLEAKDKAKKNLLIFGGIGLSLLFISIYLYRNRMLLVKNKKLQQSFLQELLQTQERVGKRISKDLHDSVGQSLLLVKNKVLQNKDQKTASIVDGVIDEVRAISRSLHPFKLEELGLTVTLQSSVEMIDENYDIFISAEIDNIDTVFDQEKEVNIYRLVQESFNNILKHSNARSAEIIVINKETDVEIIIKDNGKGFDVSKEKSSVSKIGLKTLSERSKFLKASFKILSEIDQGTTLIFNIPKHV